MWFRQDRAKWTFWIRGDAFLSAVPDQLEWQSLICLGRVHEERPLRYRLIVLLRTSYTSSIVLCFSQNRGSNFVQVPENFLTGSVDRRAF